MQLKTVLRNAGAAAMAAAILIPVNANAWDFEETYARELAHQASAAESEGPGGNWGAYFNAVMGQDAAFRDLRTEPPVRMQDPFASIPRLYERAIHGTEPGTPEHRLARLHWALGVIQEERVHNRRPMSDWGVDQVIGTLRDVGWEWGAAYLETCHGSESPEDSIPSVHEQRAGRAFYGRESRSREIGEAQEQRAEKVAPLKAMAEENGTRAEFEFSRYGCNGRMLPYPHQLTNPLHGEVGVHDWWDRPVIGGNADG